MNAVQIERQSSETPAEKFTIAHFLTVADIDRSARFYEKAFGSRILSRGDSDGAPAYIQIANTWLLVNVGQAFCEKQRFDPFREWADCTTVTRA